MPRENQLLAMQKGNLKNWLKIIEKSLRFHQTHSVFLAVGHKLQTAMIAAEVIDIQRMQADESLPIEVFNELYMLACRQHVPDYYVPEEPEKKNLTT
jgi:hypothetical protein